MRKMVTDKDIKIFNQLYLELKTYAAVSRATGFSPGTVKKYIIQDYQPVDKTKIKRFNKPLPDINLEPFCNSDDWGNMCLLSEKEQKEIHELWNELEI